MVLFSFRSSLWISQGSRRCPSHAQRSSGFARPPGECPGVTTLQSVVISVEQIYTFLIFFEDFVSPPDCLQALLGRTTLTARPPNKLKWGDAYERQFETHSERQSCVLCSLRLPHETAQEMLSFVHFCAHFTLFLVF